MEMKDVVILILSLAIVILLGFMFLDDRNLNNSEENIQSLDKYPVRTVEDCVKLAISSEEGYNNCKELGRSELLGYDDGVDCVERWANPACGGSKDTLRYSLEVSLSESCRSNFPSSIDVFANCSALLD